MNTLYNYLCLNIYWMNFDVYLKVLLLTTSSTKSREICDVEVYIYIYQENVIFFKYNHEYSVYFFMLEYLLDDF